MDVTVARHDELFELGTNTVTDILAALQSEYAEAKKTVLQVLSQPEHADPGSVHAQRLCKLLLHMDSSFYATRHDATGRMRRLPPYGY